MTSDPNIPISSNVKPINSTYFLYKDNKLQFEVPEVASVVPFIPELDHFLAN
jgi:hypothetical protein